MNLEFPDSLEWSETPGYQERKKQILLSWFSSNSLFSSFRFFILKNLLFQP